MRWVDVKCQYGGSQPSLRLGKVTAGFVQKLLYKDVRGGHKAVFLLPERPPRDTFVGTEDACRRVLEERVRIWLGDAGLTGGDK